MPGLMIRGNYVPPLMSPRSLRSLGLMICRKTSFSCYHSPKLASLVWAHEVVDSLTGFGPALFLLSSREEKALTEKEEKEGLLRNPSKNTIKLTLFLS